MIEAQQLELELDLDLDLEEILAGEVEGADAEEADVDAEQLHVAI